MKLHVNFRDALSTGFTGGRYTVKPKAVAFSVAKINLGVGVPEIPDLLGRGNLPPPNNYDRKFNLGGEGNFRYA